MRVLAISGSLRAASHNTALLRAAAELAPEGVELRLYERLESLPPYNEDRDTELPPTEVAALRRAISGRRRGPDRHPGVQRHDPRAAQARGRLGLAALRFGLGAVGQAGRRDRRQQHGLRRDLGPGSSAQGAWDRGGASPRHRASRRPGSGALRRRRSARRSGAARPARGDRRRRCRHRADSWLGRRKLMSMALHADTPARPVIAPETSMGAVSLTVSDMARSSAFYERAIGLRPFEQEDGSVAFGPSAEQPLVRLYADSSAPGLDRRRTGLYHLADPRPVKGRSRVCARAPDHRRAGRSMVRPITSSARRSTCPIPTATGSRSTVTGRARSGGTREASSRWRRCRSTSRT